MLEERAAIHPSETAGQIAADDLREAAERLQGQEATGDAGSPIALDFSIQLTAIVRREPCGGFSAEVPALPGCVTEGETLEQVRANLIDAATGWVAVKHEMELERLREDRPAADSPR